MGLVGILISAVWYVIGAEERYLVWLYRFQVKEAAEKLVQMIWHDEKARKAYRHVGEVSHDACRDLQNSESKDEKGNLKTSDEMFLEFEWLSGWRWEPISTTRLASLFPLLVLILWGILLVTTWSQAPTP